MKFIYNLLSLNLFILLVHSAAINENNQNDDPIVRNKGKSTLNRDRLFLNI